MEQKREIGLYKDAPLNFDKSTKAIQWWNDIAFLTSSSGAFGHPQAKK